MQTLIGLLSGLSTLFTITSYILDEYVSRIVIKQIHFCFVLYHKTEFWYLKILFWILNICDIFWEFTTSILATHLLRPKRPTPKIGWKDPGRNEPADTTQGRNDPDSRDQIGIPRKWQICHLVGADENWFCMMIRAFSLSDRQIVPQFYSMKIYHVEMKYEGSLRHNLWKITRIPVIR